MDTMLMLPKSPWIWTSDSYDRDNPVLVAFRRQMFLESVPEKMIVQLSADSRYRLYINGFSPVQGPCKGDGQVWYYDELDIAPYLRKGMNILAAVAVWISLLWLKASTSPLSALMWAMSLNSI